MQLNNPAQERRLANIVASIPDDQKANVIQRLANLDRLIARRHQQDSDLIDGLLRVLRSPHSKRLRELLKEIANA